MERRHTLLIATLSACIACALIIPICRSYFVEIPGKERALKACDQEIADLGIKMNEIVKIDQGIARTQKDIVDLTNVELGRMRYGRLLGKLCELMPDNVWFRSFVVTPDPEPSPFYLKPLGGKRWKIAFTGYPSGDSAKEMELRLNELLDNIRIQLGVPDKTQTARLNAAGAAPDDWGFSPFLGARFDPPRLQNVQFVTQEFLEINGKMQNAPLLLVDFKFILNFEMPVFKEGN